jgi:micrococcal nuclease
MASWRRTIPWMLGIALLAALLGARRPFGAHGDGRSGGASSGAGTPRGTLRGRVTRIVDGDTIKVAVGSRRETVRYIGIDTPEEVKPGVPVECFARRAAARNRGLVSGRAVVLRLDANPRDRYGRLLAYVYRADDGLFVNAALVRDGYARTDPFPDNRMHAALFARLDARARARRSGLWGRCGPAGIDAFPDR